MNEHTNSQGGIQRGPRRADNFTILSNDVINDARLSFRARGILLYLLSKPADWRTNSDSIARQTTEGRESVRTAMRELRGHGYIVLEKVRLESGQIITVQTVYEEPVDVTESQVTPAPRIPVVGVADAEKPGRFTKDSSPRTETNNHKAPRERSPRQCDTAVMGSLSEKAQKILAEDHRVLADLEAATLAAGLPASYGRVKATVRSEIVTLVERHGIPALVDAAKKAHRPENPTQHVHGWMRLWQAMPAPRAARVAAPLCGTCVEGWIEDADGMPVRRCECRTTVSA